MNMVEIEAMEPLKKQGKEKNIEEWLSEIHEIRSAIWNAR